MDELRVCDAIDEIFALLRRCNKYIDETTPWVLGKEADQQDRLATVLYHLLECIRISAILLSSFMPETAEKILKQLQTKETSDMTFGLLETGIHVCEKPEILFARIDAKEMMAKIEEEQKQAQKEKAKEAKKEAKAAEKKEAAAKEQINFADFEKIELKVGVIKACEKHPNADRLLVFQVDLGEEKPRQIVSSIAKFYEPSEVIGKRVIVVTNLKPAKFRGMESNGMLLCATVGDDEDLDLLTITKDFAGGTSVD